MCAGENEAEREQYDTRRVGVRAKFIHTNNWAEPISQPAIQPAESKPGRKMIVLQKYITHKSNNNKKNQEEAQGN